MARSDNTRADNTRADNTRADNTRADNTRADNTRADDVQPNDQGRGGDGERASDKHVPEGLTASQAARRQRVIRTALDLAASGGYDAVQMRDVATRANVALGTIYRYFPSKDALLASGMVQWMADLESAVEAYPPRGATTAERVMDVMSRALRAMDREPALTRSVIAALTAGDPIGVAALNDMIDSFARILLPAFPDGVDPVVETSTAKMLGHIWWSALVCWAGGMGDMTWVAAELTEGADLLTGSLD